jgi:hypothetical protein
MLLLLLIRACAGAVDVLADLGRGMRHTAVVMDLVNLRRSYAFVESTTGDLQLALV